MGSAASRTPIAPKPHIDVASAKGKKKPEDRVEDAVFPFPSSASVLYAVDIEDEVTSLRASHGSGSDASMPNDLGEMSFASSRFDPRGSNGGYAQPPALQMDSARSDSCRDGRPAMPRTWKKGESIGSGSFGTVYLGLNNQTGAHADMQQCTKVTAFRNILP